MTNHLLRFSRDHNLGWDSKSFKSTSHPFSFQFCVPEVNSDLHAKVVCGVEVESWNNDLGSMYKSLRCTSFSFMTGIAAFSPTKHMYWQRFLIATDPRWEYSGKSSTTSGALLDGNVGDRANSLISCHKTHYFRLASRRTRAQHNRNSCKPFLERRV
jgi:hypothetical protein